MIDDMLKNQNVREVITKAEAEELNKNYLRSHETLDLMLREYKSTDLSERKKEWEKSLLTGAYLCGSGFVSCFLGGAGASEGFIYAGIGLLAASVIPSLWTYGTSLIHDKKVYLYGDIKNSKKWLSKVKPIGRKAYRVVPIEYVSSIPVKTIMDKRNLFLLNNVEFKEGGYYYGKRITKWKDLKTQESHNIYDFCYRLSVPEHFDKFNSFNVKLNTSDDFVGMNFPTANGKKYFLIGKMDHNEFSSEYTIIPIEWGPARFSERK